MILSWLLFLFYIRSIRSRRDLSTLPSTVTAPCIFQQLLKWIVSQPSLVSHFLCFISLRSPCFHFYVSFLHLVSIACMLLQLDLWHDTLKYQAFHRHPRIFLKQFIFNNTFHTANRNIIGIPPCPLEHVLTFSFLHQTQHSWHTLLLRCSQLLLQEPSFSRNPGTQAHKQTLSYLSGSSECPRLGKGREIMKTKEMTSFLLMYRMFVGASMNKCKLLLHVEGAWLVLSFICPFVCPSAA
jgi:hypothetical protein